MNDRLALSEDGERSPNSQNGRDSRGVKRPPVDPISEEELRRNPISEEQLGRDFRKTREVKKLKSRDAEVKLMRLRGKSEWKHHFEDRLETISECGEIGAACSEPGIRFTGGRTPVGAAAPMTFHPFQSRGSRSTDATTNDRCAHRRLQSEHLHLQKSFALLRQLVAESFRFADACSREEERKELLKTTRQLEAKVASLREEVNEYREQNELLEFRILELNTYQGKELELERVNIVTKSVTSPVVSEDEGLGDDGAVSSLDERPIDSLESTPSETEQLIQHFRVSQNLRCAEPISDELPSVPFEKVAVLELLRQCGGQEILKLFPVNDAWLQSQTDNLVNNLENAELWNQIREHEQQFPDTIIGKEEFKHFFALVIKERIENLASQAGNSFSELSLKGDTAEQGTQTEVVAPTRKDAFQNTDCFIAENCWNILRDVSEPQMDDKTLELCSVRIDAKMQLNDRILKETKAIILPVTKPVSANCGTAEVYDGTLLGVEQTRTRLSGSVSELEDSSPVVRFIESNHLKEAEREKTLTESEAGRSASDSHLLCSLSDLQNLEDSQGLAEETFERPSVEERLRELEKKEAAYAETLELADDIFHQMELGYKQKIAGLEFSEQILRQRISQLEESAQSMESELRDRRSGGRKMGELFQELTDAESREASLAERLRDLEKCQKTLLRKSLTSEREKERLREELREREEAACDLLAWQCKVASLEDEITHLKHSVLAFEEALRQANDVLLHREEELRRQIVNLEKEKRQTEEVVAQLRQQVKLLEENLECIRNEGAMRANKVIKANLRSEVSGTFWFSPKKAAQLKRTGILYPTYTKLSLRKEALLVTKCLQNQLDLSANGAPEPESPNNLKVLRQVGRDSLLVGWSPPQKCSSVQCYQIFVEGRLHQQARSPDRTKALLNKLDLSSGPFCISICSLTEAGALSRPARVVFQPASFPTKQTEQLAQHGV